MKTFKVTVFLEVEAADNEEETLTEAVRDALENALDAHDFGEQPLEYTIEEDDEDF